MFLTFSEPVRRALHNTHRELRTDHVNLGALTLPAKHLRSCGDAFKDDDYFLASARVEADRLIRECHLSRESRIVDPGWSVGRLPIGILSQKLEVRSYLGIDVDERSIRWCKKHILSRHSQLKSSYGYSQCAL